MRSRPPELQRASSTSTRTPPTRAAIVDDLDDTLFVEAGAGSGKTQVARRPRGRARHARAAYRCARSPRSRSPRRRPPSCATGSAARSRRRARSATRPPPRARAAAARRARRRRGVHAARVRAAAAHRAPDRGRAPAAHRGARRHRVAGGVRGTLDPLRRPSCSTTPRSSARCSSRSTPTPASPRCAPSRSRATPTGTSSPSAWVPSPTRRRSPMRWSRCSPRSPTSGRARPHVHRSRRQARSSRCSTSPAGTTELLHAPDEYEQLRLLTAGRAEGQPAPSGRKDNWPPTCDGRRRPRPRSPPCASS